jgi:1-deoxy-D-xylulose-5-phosphate reductoisomerase
MIANKEPLVMAGDLLIAAVTRGRRDACCRSTASTTRFSNVCHRAAEPGRAPQGVRRILLTASGGPFVDWPQARLETVTPAQACAHPKWVMGRKISVDSATLMNKGLEVIEARRLFGLAPEQVEVVVHRAKSGALAGRVRRRLAARPARLAGHAYTDRPRPRLAGTARLRLYNRSIFAAAGMLQFEPPDMDRFPCLAPRAASRASRAASRPPCSTPPTRWPSQRSWRGV